MAEKLNIDPDSIEDLGKVPDRVIAERLGCGAAWVRRKRSEKGISPFQPQKGRVTTDPNINWDLIPLGIKTDTQIGEELGMSYLMVSYYRKKRGISSFAEARKQRLKSVPLDVLMARGNTQELAKKLGYKGIGRIGKLRAAIDPSRVLPRMDPEEKKKLLSELDTTLSGTLQEKYKVSVSTIYQLRKQKGIESPFKEKRVCMCGKEFEALKRPNVWCSEECRDAYHDLHKLVDFSANEPLDPILFRMVMQIEKKLRPKIRRINWAKNTKELHETDIDELCKRYALERDHIVRTRKKYPQKERRNETNQAQPTNESARQPNDATSRRRRKEGRDTGSRSPHALPDSAGESRP